LKGKYMKSKYTAAALRFTAAVTTIEGKLRATLAESPEASVRVLDEGRTVHKEALRRAVEEVDGTCFYHDVLRHEFDSVLRTAEYILTEPPRRSYEQQALITRGQSTDLERVVAQRIREVGEIAAYYDEARTRFDVFIGLTTDYLMARSWRRNRTYRLGDGSTVKMKLPLVVCPGSLDVSFSALGTSLRVDGEYVPAKEGDLSCALASFLTPRGSKLVEQFARVAFGQQWTARRVQDHYPQSGLISE
jgi:hypothetical protein